MHYCRVICLVSSTDQIYHLAASRLGDKFDRSMTLGKLLGNNALLFIFISSLKHHFILISYRQFFFRFLNEMAFSDKIQKYRCKYRAYLLIFIISTCHTAVSALKSRKLYITKCKAALTPHHSSQAKLSVITAGSHETGLRQT